MARTRLSRPERAALTRSELLKASERRFYRDGYHGTTLEAIAEDAGYSKGAVYSAFDSKAGLFLALLDVIIDRRLHEITALFDQHPPGQTRISTLAERPAEKRNQQWLLLTIDFLTHAARDPGLLDLLAARYRRLRAGLAQLASETSTALGAEHWAIVTLALANGLALERLIDPDGVPDDLMARTQRLLYPAQPR